MTMTDNTTWTVAKRLKMSRLMAEIDQQAMADALGVSRPTVSDWERGKTEPTLSRFVKWATLTGQPVDWFAEGVDVSETKLAPSEDRASSDSYTPPDLNREPTD